MGQAVWHCGGKRATLGATFAPAMPQLEPRTSPESPAAAQKINHFQKPNANLLSTMARTALIYRLAQQIQYGHAHRNPMLHLIQNDGIGAVCQFSINFHPSIHWPWVQN